MRTTMNQWPFQEPKLEVPASQKFYVRATSQGDIPSFYACHMALSIGSVSRPLNEAAKIGS